MAHQTIDDISLVEKLLDVFRRYGYDNASLMQLSEATGLKKSSLYHRFPAGKDDMAKAVAEHTSVMLQQLIITPLQDKQISPTKRFSKMLETLSAFYKDGRENCLFNVLTIGNIKTEIRALLNDDYAAWLDALIKLAKETGLSTKVAKNRAEHFLIVVQGTLVIQRLTKNLKTFHNSLQYEQKQFFSANQ